MQEAKGSATDTKMADLPIDRLTPAPPFSYVGLDVFGPWLVSTQQTRGGMANNKRWAVLLNCLTTRAMHIEVIESMDASCFINTLHRFLAFRGPAVQFCSDCGTNFVGVRKEFQSSLKEMDGRAIQSCLATGSSMLLRPPMLAEFGNE